MKDKHSDILFQGSNDWIIPQEQIIENKYTFKSAMFMNPLTEDLISKHEVINIVGWEEIKILKRIDFKEVISYIFYDWNKFPMSTYSVSEGFCAKKCRFGSLGWSFDFWKLQYAFTVHQVHLLSPKIKENLIPRDTSPLTMTMNQLSY